MSSAVHIIAEAGNNHNGQLEVACQLVDVAAAAGADSIKFQVIYPAGLYLPRLYQNGALVDNAVFQKRLAGQLPDGAYAALAAYGRDRHLPFSASVFDQRGLDLLAQLGVPYIKIASCDLNNSRLLRQAAERGHKLVVSTGMATLGEVERAVSDVFATGHTDLVLMHCVSVYPCCLEKMNLGFITTLKQAFGLPVGLSDHTEGSLAAAMALSLGATWIEKHFTLDRKQEGFDHAYAMEPEALTAYIRDVRAAEQALARPAAKVQAEEATVRGRARRALYAAREVQPGEVLQESDVLVVRPQGPLSPNDLPLVLGRKAHSLIHQFEALSLDQL